MAGNSRIRGVLRGVTNRTTDSESKDTFEDLLVFGYACKLFRDDEKASSIDQGKLLIPWMGDETIKIDRYDARGTLFDLKPLEPPPGGYGDRSEGLTAEERRIEELCDEERYFALYKDEMEEAVIKEEEIKRINQDLTEVTSDEVSYRQVPFVYGNQSAEGSDLNQQMNADAPLKSIVGELGDAVFIPPPTLDIPPDMVVPPTQKLARIIEKTAQFISSQGTQMEIIVKTKQGNNPMFQFLHFDCALHPFYRHILTAIRSGTYVVPAEDELENGGSKSSQTNGQANESDSDDNHYLHPSLQAKVPEQIASPTEKNAKTEDSSASQSSLETRSLIDKTASYMSRKGRNLEAIVLSKGDARFSFLEPEHTLHSYYLEKLNLYSEMRRTLATEQQDNEESKPVEPNTVPVAVGDLELVKSERRKRAALFLDQIKKEKAAACEGSDITEEDGRAESESTGSTAKKSKSASPNEVEFVNSYQRTSKERTRSSRSLSPPAKRRKERRSRSRRRSTTRSRSRLRSRSTSRSRRRSRSWSPHRRSPTPDRRRRHRHKKHRSRDRHRRQKKRRRSHERSRKKHSRRRSSRSVSRSKSKTPSSIASRSPSRNRSRSRSRSVSRSKSRSRSASSQVVAESRSPSEILRSPVVPITHTSNSRSETSSPLPSQLLTVQPAFAKIAEGIRAKVIAMIEGDTNKK